MKVILTKEMPNLGKPGEMKNVADGYARNFLIPLGFAIPATESSVSSLNQRLAEARAREERERRGYAALAQKLASVELRFPLKIGARGQVFGSVTTEDIREKLAAQGIRLDRHWIQLEYDIKTTGEHQVKIKFPHQIVGEIKIIVEAA